MQTLIHRIKLAHQRFIGLFANGGSTAVFSFVVFGLVVISAIDGNQSLFTNLISILATVIRLYVIFIVVDVIFTTTSNRRS